MPVVVEDAVKPPSALLTLTELPRALFELGTYPLGRGILGGLAPRGDGHAVLVLPGFMTSDISTTPLRRYLRSLGYQAHAWKLGRNLGPKAIGVEGERLDARINEIHAATGRKVSLVGWSLGGVMARQVSRRYPELVRQVISLGSPIAGNPPATRVTRLYETMSGQRVGDADVRALMEEGLTAPPVPSTAIYTREDGIAAWRHCVEAVGHQTDNIEVHGSHCGLGVNSVVLYAIADRLALPEGEWKPFERGGLRSIFFPSSGHLH